MDGVLHRAVEAAGELDYRALLQSGLYDELVGEGLLVRHEEAAATDWPLGAVHAMRPDRVPVISYACEWTFSQLRAAALLTLDIQARALRRGMSLRDASSFNVQFVGVRPIFIDTLSFARSAPGPEPWVAYRQFCAHFLAPLALIAYHGHSISALWAVGIEGVALPEASRLLPAASWMRPGIALHVHLHAKAIGRHPDPDAVPRRHGGASDFGLRLVKSLQAAVQGLSLRSERRTVWSEYRMQSTYTANDTVAKLDFVRSCAAEVAPSRALDLGANDGLYAALLARNGVPVTAVDADALSCEAVFNGHAREYSDRINTARVDLVNPTPAFGWAGEERSDFHSRYRCDLVLALALVHHLSIARQIPFASVAQWFARLGEHLIVEYVPVDDPMASRLLAARSIRFSEGAFGEQAFLDAFAKYFSVRRRSGASSAGRVLFWMQRLSTLP